MKAVLGEWIWDAFVAMDHERHGMIRNGTYGWGKNKIEFEKFRDHNFVHIYGDVWGIYELHVSDRMKAEMEGKKAELRRVANAEFSDSELEYMREKEESVDEAIGEAQSALRKIKMAEEIDDTALFKRAMAIKNGVKL